MDIFGDTKMTNPIKDWSLIYFLTPANSLTDTRCF